MIKRWRWWGWRFSISAAKVVDVKGVNSILPDGHHALMWDFDHMHRWAVITELTRIQREYCLPSIYVASTGGGSHYIAICLSRLRFRETLQIMASTKGVDVSFLKYGIYRGHWTLRVSPKGTRHIKPLVVLKSAVKETVFPYEFKSFIKYESTNL